MAPTNLKQLFLRLGDLCIHAFLSRNPDIESEHVVVAVFAIRVLVHVAKLKIWFAFALRRRHLGVLLADFLRIDLDLGIALPHQIEKID